MFDESAACDMHDGDKIGRAVIGEFVRSWSRVPENPFEGCVTIIAKFQGMSKTLSSSLSNRAKCLVVLNANRDVLRTGIKCDLNKTLSSPRQNLLNTSFTIKKVLRVYETTHEPPDFPSIGEWN